MDAEQVFKAMGDRTRQRALAVLQAHELSVSELVEVLDQPQSTVSRHLRTLKQAGLIRDRRDGTTALYSLAAHRAGHGGETGTGQASLATRLMSWLADQPMEESLTRRLADVISRRSHRSRCFFSKVGRQWDALREETFGTTFHLEAMLALLPAGWIVADIGTGTGFLLPALARRFAEVIGIDPIEEMLEVARDRVAVEQLTNVELRGGDMSALPIDTAAVDLAVATLVLHHVASPPDALKELRRVVRPGGRALIVEQHAHGDETFRERMQDTWWGFEPDDLATMLRQAGFEHDGICELSTGDRPAGTPGLYAVAATTVTSGHK